MVGPLLYTKRQTELSFLLNSWLNLATEAIKLHVSDEKSKRLKFTLNMEFSVIFISGLLVGLPEDYGWIDLNDPGERQALMEYAIEQILG